MAFNRDHMNYGSIKNPDMKTESKHTPGPWTVESYTVDVINGEPENVLTIRASDNVYVAEIREMADEDTIDANARLIAKAPLLEECTETLKHAWAAIHLACEERDPKANGGLGLANPEEQVAIEMIRQLLAKLEE